jgi:hypothetical protein
MFLMFAAEFQAYGERPAAACKAVAAQEIKTAETLDKRTPFV